MAQPAFEPGDPEPPRRAAADVEWVMAGLRSRWATGLIGAIAAGGALVGFQGEFEETPGVVLDRQ